MSGKRAKRKRKICEWLDSLSLSHFKPLVEKYPTLFLNKQFSRLETPKWHYYIKQWPPIPPGPNKHMGRFKCKLMHGKGWTVIVPDQIYIKNGSSWNWIQPLAFGSNSCVKTDHDSACELRVDISLGESVKVRFMGAPPLRTFEDGAHLYECEIFGPKDLVSHSTGSASFDADNVPYLHLFHHTTKEALPKILDSENFRTGDCNIQGTTKKLVNVAYAYFTPLAFIKYNEDLKKVAMSEDARICLRRDGADLPEPLMPGQEAEYPDDILVLDVYASDPRKREAAIAVWIDATVLAPQHIYRHKYPGEPVFYEITHEFIQRVGMLPGKTLRFDESKRITRNPDLKSFDYVVVGDCTTLQGLAAPYDEEDTTHILKIERVTDGASFVEFWFDNANSDLFSGEDSEMQQFL